MGLTYQQAIALGVGHLHPSASGGPSKERELLDRIDAGSKPPSRAPADGMNKTERRFRDEVLEPAWARGAIDDYLREPIKLRIAGRTFYTPDFFVVERSGMPYTFIEIKGFMRDDAAVKLKTVADKYPCFRWLLIRRDGWTWDVHEVDCYGIGRRPVQVPWIHGGPA